MSLSRNDLSVIEGDARVQCRRLSEALGFNRVNDVHRLIRANEDELADFGEVFCFSAKNPSAKGGRPTITYYLNEHQAIAIAMWAQTAKAREARRQIIDVFVSWRRGETLPPQPQTQDVFKAGAERTGDVAEHLQNLQGMEEFVFHVSHLPIWKNGRRPRWWSDLEVRVFIITAHRQMSTLEAEREGQKRYGDRCPKKSAINDFWLRLDGIVGLPLATRATPAKPEFSTRRIALAKPVASSAVQK